MNQQILKSEILSWVSQINDNSTLFTLKSIKDSFNSENDWYDDLTFEQIDSIKKGEHDIKLGKIFSNEEFWSFYDK